MIGSASSRHLEIVRLQQKDGKRTTQPSCVSFISTRRPPLTRIECFRHDQYGSDNQDPGLIFAILHFNPATPVGQDLHVSLALNDLMAVLQFSSQ
jgi:hypothetical protein